VANRMGGLKEMESWMMAGFDARAKLVNQLLELANNNTVNNTNSSCSRGDGDGGGDGKNNGMSVFRERWSILKNARTPTTKTSEQDDDGGTGTSTRTAHRSAAADIFARAALQTSLGMQRLELTDLMACAYQMSSCCDADDDNYNENENPGTGTDAKKVNVKWPIIGIVFPELSSWNLGQGAHSVSTSSTASSVEELFVILERECPELSAGTYSSGSDDDAMNAMAVEEETWKLFFQNSRLCDSPALQANDMSLAVHVHHSSKTRITANVLRSAASRLYAVSTFLSKVVEFVTSPEQCGRCGIVPVGEHPDVELKRCSRCQCVFYCSRECQSADFKGGDGGGDGGGHKKQCRKLAVLKERYGSEHYLPLSSKHDVSEVHVCLEAFLYPTLRDEVLSRLKEDVDVLAKSLKG